MNELVSEINAAFAFGDLAAVVEASWQHRQVDVMSQVAKEAGLAAKAFIAR